jgi:hypothetical protein
LTNVVHAPGEMLWTVSVGQGDLHVGGGGVAGWNTGAYVAKPVGKVEVTAWASGAWRRSAIRDRLCHLDLLTPGDPLVTTRRT